SGDIFFRTNRPSAEGSLRQLPSFPRPCHVPAPLPARQLSFGGRLCQYRGFFLARAPLLRRSGEQRAREVFLPTAFFPFLRRPFSLARILFSFPEALSFSLFPPSFPRGAAWNHRLWQ